MKDFVYVIGAETGPQKIGIAGDVGRRLKSIQTGSHVPIRVAFSIEANGAAEHVENYAHWVLREKRMAGEWFNVAPEEAVAAINEAVAAVARGERKERVVGNVGRKKLYDIRILLPLKSETLERLDGLLGEGETRLDLIREAIDRELKRRERRS